MFGCLRRIGCLVLLAVLAVCAWIFRDRWMPMVVGDRRPVAATWEPVTPAREAKARDALQSLGQKSGPVFTNLKAADLAAVLLDGSAGGLPASVQGAEATVEGDQVHLRATIDLDDIKGLDILGPFGDFVGKRERFELGGTLDVVSPGVGEYRVESARIGDLPIPKQAIPKLLQRLQRGVRPPGLAPNGVPFKLPAYVGDMRVGKGRVTLYKNVS
ncbi:MAG: hypothetical protein U0132_09360 [Gemmatimonadaceae bacterium]